MTASKVPTSERGLFITLDGPSGVGKTTVCALLGQRFISHDIPTMVTTTPSSSPLGKLARYGTREFSGDALSCLVAADRYHHVAEVVRPAVERGTVVVCDRYLPSSLVLDSIDGVKLEQVLCMYQSILVPDLAVVLTGSAAVCAERAARRGGYSRFHDIAQADAGRELSLFLAAVDLLKAAEYPIYQLDTGASSAEEVAEDLAIIAMAKKGVRACE